MSLKIYLLGQFKLTSNDLPLELPSRPAQSTLAYLALNPGASIRREKLASLLWPEATEPNARAYLRQALWRIRKAFDSASLNWQDFLLSGDISVSFSDTADCWLDAGALTAPQPGASADDLVTTVELYKGELLPGFYDDWVLPERDRLQAAFHQKMNQLLEALLLSSRWNEALIWSERWIQLGQAPEPAFRALMQAHAGLGDQAMVSAAYQRCRQTLQRDLGLDPSPETRRLYEQILQGELESPPAEPTRASQPVPQPPPFLQEDHPERVERAPFVAREQELDKLDTFLNLALDNQGRVVFVTGEAGSGKTALIGEFARRAQEKHPDLVVASGNCNAQTGIGDPYLPFREVLELLCGDVEARWAAGALTREHARRLWNTLPLTARALVEHGPDLVGTFVHSPAILNEVRKISSQHEGWPLRPEKFLEIKSQLNIPLGAIQHDLFLQYARVLAVLSRSRPLLISLDDLQWADSGSINLLFHLGRSLEGSRILVLGAYRPEEVDLGRDGKRHPLEPVLNEFQRLWGDITTNLDVVEGIQFIEAVLANEPNKLGDSFKQKLFKQTRGHPLFTIELLRGMQERGDLIQDLDGYWIEGPELDWVTVPARVEAVISERVGRLSKPLRDILRTASVEGEIFTAEVIARVHTIEDTAILGKLSRDLDRRHHLVRTQSIQRVNGQLLSRYRFRHILIQKYLYSSLDEVERVHLHEQVGAVLEDYYEQLEDFSTETAITPQLARHFREAKLAEKTIRYQHLAGERALKMSAYHEARIHLKGALDLLKTQPISPQRDSLELGLQIDLGLAWIGYPGLEWENACNRALELGRKTGETPQLCRVLCYLAIIYYVRAEHHKALEMAQEALTIALDDEDHHLVAFSNWILGFINYTLGKFKVARSHLEITIDFYDPDLHHKEFANLRGVDAGLSSMAYMACCLWCLGFPDQALKYSQRSLELARELGHPFSLADVLSFAGCQFQVQCRDGKQLEAAAIELERLSKEVVPSWKGAGTRFRGEAFVILGKEKEGIAVMQEGIAECKSIEVRVNFPRTLIFLAEASGNLGEIEDGFKYLKNAYENVQETGERSWETELYRLQGRIHQLQGNDIEAEASFQNAIEVAKKQDAKMWELRATVELAKLWQQQGKLAQVSDMLAEIYGWFTEGFDTPDLIEAKALLDQLPKP